MNRILASTQSAGRALRGGLGVAAAQCQGLFFAGQQACSYTCAQAGYFGWQLTTR